MSVFNFFLPGDFGITQNTELYVMDPVNPGDRQYHWRINCGSTLNLMFNTRTYIQNSLNEENVNICLDINQTYVNGLFNASGLVYNALSGIGPDFVGIDTAGAPFSQRLLEMTALKIFKHAKARAAIGNDNDFLTLYSNVTTHIVDAFANELIKLNFFEQYIASRGAIAGNALPDDISALTQFNLANTEMFIYGTLNGNITDTTPITFYNFPVTNYSTNMRIELSTG